MLCWQRTTLRTSCIRRFDSTVPEPILPARLRSPNARLLQVSAALINAGAWYLGRTVNARQAVLYLVGALLAIAHYHSVCGSIESWRTFIAEGSHAGLRVEMVMLVVGVTLFFPALAAGSFVVTTYLALWSALPVLRHISPVNGSVLDPRLQYTGFNARRRSQR